MNTTALHTFITVMELGNISQAAEQLYLTQPAVSKRIKNLEEEFGVTLFDAVGRSIVPTQAAQYLLVHAKRWLADYNQVKHSVSQSKDTVSGKLSIGTSHHIGLHHLSPLLKDFVQNYPDVQLDVHFVDSETGHAAVMSGELEMAFLTLPPNFNKKTKDKRLSYHPLWHDDLVFVAANFSELATQNDITLKQLAALPALLPAAHTYTSQITLAAFAKKGLKPQATMSTNPLESIRMMVSIGLGWSALPKTLLNDSLAELHIKNPPNLARTLGMVTNSARTQSAAVKALVTQTQHIRIEHSS